MRLPYFLLFVTCRLKVLLADSVDLTRHFIDLFAPALVFFKPILLQLRDSIAVTERCEDLRRDGLLNPINEEAAMSLPTLKPVSTVVSHGQIVLPFGDTDLCHVREICFWAFSCRVVLILSNHTCDVSLFFAS
jgi:hypothetical protein